MARLERAIRMRAPDFFIVGAKRCGTTSMRRYLASHPQIFVPEQPDEPRFFSTDLRPSLKPRLSNADYCRLFDGANGIHRAAGEGSPVYLYSRTAVANILEFNPAARFIVMLRSPIEMVASVHARNLYDTFEDETDLEAAWRLSEERKRGRRIPPFCYEPKELLYYSDFCMIGGQLERLYQQVARERVMVSFFDDLKGRPQEVYERALDFLGVPSDGRRDFAPYMDNRRRRSIWLNRAMITAELAKRRAGLRFSSGLGRRLDGFNTVRTKRAPLRPEFRRELIAHFRQDIEKLAGLTGRDLGTWLQPD
jgi:hypothetical protein